MKKIYVSLILFILSVANYASADCGFVMSIPTFDYVVGDNNQTEYSNLTLTRNDYFDFFTCPLYYVAFRSSAGDPTNNRTAKHSLGNEKINYNLYNNINLQYVLRGDGSTFSTNQVINGSINGGQTLELPYYFSLVGNYSNTNIRPGLYLDTINVQSYSSGLFGWIKTSQSSGVLNVRINVPKYIALSIIDSGGVFDESKTSKVLDFGELEDGGVQSFDIRVVTNSGYSLKVSSENRGKFKRINGSGNSSLIGYKFYVNNSNVPTNLNSASPVEISKLNSGATPQGGAVIPVKIAVESVSNKDPGDYQDYITLSVVSTN